MRLVTKSYDRLLPPEPVPPRADLQGETVSHDDPAADRMYRRLSPKQTDLGALPAARPGSARRGPELDEEARDTILHRLWSEATPWVAAAVETRCGDVMAADYDVVSRATGASDDKEAEVIEQIHFLLENPYPESGKNKQDGDEDADYPGLVGPVTRDMIVVGRGVIKPWYTEGGYPWRLEPFDAQRVRRNPAWHPGGTGGKWLVSREDDPNKEDEVGAAELIVMEMTDTTYSAEGLSPMMAIHRFLVAEMDVFRAMHYVNKNMQATGVLKVPTPNTRTINRIIQEWKARVQGKGGIVIANLPEGTEFLNISSHNLAAMGTMDFYDLLLRGIGVALRFPTSRMNWTRTLLDRQAEEQASIYDEGKIALLRLWQRMWNRRVVRLFYGADNLRLVYRELAAMEDAAESADLITAKAGAGVQIWSVAQLWEAAGNGDLPYKDEQLEADPVLKAYLHEPRWQVAPGIYLPISEARKVLAKQFSTDQQPAADALPKPGEMHDVSPRAYLSVVGKEAEVNTPPQNTSLRSHSGEPPPDTEQMEIERQFAEDLDLAFDRHLTATRATADEA